MNYAKGKTWYLFGALSYALREQILSHNEQGK